MRSSGEDYLETIYLLNKRTGNVRSVDVASELGYSKASISRALGILKQNGFISVNPDGQIKLTKTGLKEAEEVYSRHTVLKEFLTGVLGVNETTAEHDACSIEHVLSEETFLRLKSFMGEYSGDKPAK